jgi:hypothetical protein
VALAVPTQWGPFGFAGSEAEFWALPAAGNWLVAIVAFRVTNDTDPQVHVGDMPRNMWTLVYDDAEFASAWYDAAKLKVQIWACPAAVYDGWDSLRGIVVTMAQADVTADARTVLVKVFEVSGFIGNNLTVDSVTVNTASSATSFSVVVPAPGANCFVLGAAIIDDDGTTTLTPTGVGFTSLGALALDVPDAQMNGQWRAASGAVTASWTSSAARNWAGVAVAIRETGDAVPADPDFPTPKFELGFGYDQSVPLSAVRWTDQTDRLVSPGMQVPVFSAKRGVPYELGTTQSEPTDLKIRNDDGAFTPRTVNTAAVASAAGTTTTIKILDADAADINTSDFFRLKASGAFKELTVFQVSGLSSSAGTTTVTFARADGLGGAAVATASGDVYEGIEIDLDMPWRYRMWWDGKWHPLGSGWLGQLPQTWLTPNWGEVPAVGVDALASLTAECRSPLAGEILRRRPVAYWPLGDATGSAKALDASGSNAPPLVKTVSKYGAGTDTTADFGASTQDFDPGLTLGTKTTILGDSGSGWQQSGLTSTELNDRKGYALVASGGNFPAISGGITIFGVITISNADLTVVANSTRDPTIVQIKNSDPAYASGSSGGGSVLKVSFEGQAGADAFKPKVATWDKDTHVLTETVASAFQLASASFFRPFCVAFNRTSWRFSMDGVVQTGSCDLTNVFDLVDVGGEADQFWSGQAFPGVVAHVAIFPRMLTDQEMNGLVSAALDGEVLGNFTSGYVANKLNVAGWNGPRIVMPSLVLMSHEGDPGGTVADYAEDAAAMDDGLQFCDALGQYQWRGHDQGYYQTPKAVLGEDTGAGEIPYQRGQKYGFDKTFIYNDVQLVNQKSDSSAKLKSGTLETRYAASDDASQAKYGKRTLSLTTRLNSVADAYGLTWALANRYARPKLRVEQVVIDAASNPDAWSFCLSAEQGDLVTVNRRPMGAPVISQLCRVLRIENDTGPSRGVFTLSLAPAALGLVANGPTPIGDGTIGW